MKEDPEGDIDEAAAILSEDTEGPLTEEEKMQRKCADRELREVYVFLTPSWMSLILLEFIMLTILFIRPRFLQTGSAIAWAR